MNENMKTTLCMALNIFCVVSIVIVNKSIYQDHGFTFPNVLIAIHFGITGFFAWITAKAGYLEPKRAPFNDLLKLSLSQVGSVAFVNFSLMYNSVGMYQVLKLLNIPVICVMEYFWKGTSYSADIKSSLYILLLGVGLATVTTVNLSPAGLTYGILATITTGIYQILAKAKQTEHNINPLQLLYYQSPLTCAMLVVVALLMDDIPRLATWLNPAQFKSNKFAMTIILLSGVIAFGVNLTLYLIVGRTSPVTYQVVGHFKTVMVIVFGIVIIHDPVNTKNILGISIAMIGMIWYTQINLDKQKRQKAAQEAEKFSMEIEKAISISSDSQLNNQKI